MVGSWLPALSTCGPASAAAAQILTYKGARKTTYTVRWVVAGKAWREPFGTVALAEGFRSELVRATGKGEAFVIATGLPVSHRCQSASMSWYAFAVGYVDARWAELGGNSRKNTAKTLTAVTIALLRAQPTQFAPVAVRTALREWAFNATRRAHAPRDVVAILRWVERNSLPVSAWEEPEKVDGVLRAVDTRLDGKQAAAWSRKRHRRILNVVMKYAIRRRGNPLPKGKESTTVTKTSNAVDKRSLMNADQAVALLDWIRRRPRGGPRLHAFFATLYYCALRPEEAVAMRVQDVTLPGPGAGDQWCELLIHTATPEVGKQWTDTGEIHEERDLKGRAEGETRTVPGASRPDAHPAATHRGRTAQAGGSPLPGGDGRHSRWFGHSSGVAQRAQGCPAPARFRVAHREAGVRQPAHAPHEVAQRRNSTRPGGRMGREQRAGAAGHLRAMRRGAAA